MEETAKRTKALKAYFEANISDAQVPCAKQFFGFFDATLDEILMRSLIKCLPEKPQKVISGKTRLARYLIEVQGKIVTGVDKVTRPFKSLKDLSR